jgi:tetratricopeptide (TPR) repeat protein
MKKIIIAILILGSLPCLTFAQENTEGDTLIPMEVQRQIFVYGASKKYNDKMMQLSTLYNLLAFNRNNSAILDSIALVYFGLQQYVSAALVSVDAVLLNPKDELAAEIAALSFEQIGATERALKYYETLYLLRNDIMILYQVSFLQYRLKRLNEAFTNVGIIIAHAKSNEVQIRFPKNDESEQEVALRTAAKRLKAMIYEEQGNVLEATKIYKDILLISPDFDLVKKQLEDLN